MCALETAALGGTGAVSAQGSTLASPISTVSRCQPPLQGEHSVPCHSQRCRLEGDGRLARPAMRGTASEHQARLSRKLFGHLK